MNVALIVAGGSGVRTGLNVPKQFVVINDKPVLVYTIEAFEKNNNIDSIILVVHQNYIDEVNKWKELYQLHKVKAIVKGGQVRQESVFNGLNKLMELGYKEDDIVLIHDGARPLVDDTIIDENIASTKTYGASVTAVKASDTILHSNSENIEKVLNRDEIYLEQTPASFKFSLIYEAHQKYQHQDNTDDCALLIKDGYKIHIVNGNKNNFKITTSEDLKLFELLTKKEN